MSLKSSNKTDVNITELVISIDAEALRLLLKRNIRDRRRISRSRDSEKAR